MGKPSPITRRNLLVRLGGAALLLPLAGCRKIGESVWLNRLLAFGERATYKTHRLLLTRKAMAQEFSEREGSPRFRSNGTSSPQNPEYQALAARGFRDYRLSVSGLVERPADFSLEDLRRFPHRTQTTRHDCVEGWSVIGTWRGVRLSTLLEQVHPRPQARFAVFFCADPMGGSDGPKYYESIDLEDAFHPQTILAYELNGKPLPIANGAPLRLRVERQLGYKMAKYVMGIELVDDFTSIGGGKGGYWEDRGYEWYAGI